MTIKKELENFIEHYGVDDFLDVLVEVLEKFGVKIEIKVIK